MIFFFVKSRESLIFSHKYMQGFINNKYKNQNYPPPPLEDLGGGRYNPPLAQPPLPLIKL